MTMRITVINESSNIGKDLNVVSEIIQIINEQGHYPLLPEVVTWALLYMKENPSSTISEAIVAGYREWIK
jgi:hypothetical protein